MANSIGTKLGNINGETFSMNYINVKHLVRLYDVQTVLHWRKIPRLNLRMVGKRGTVRGWILKLNKRKENKKTCVCK